LNKLKKEFESSNVLSYSQIVEIAKHSGIFGNKTLMLEGILRCLVELDALKMKIDISCPICGEHLGVFDSIRDLDHTITLICLNGHEIEISQNFIYENLGRYVSIIFGINNKDVFEEIVKGERPLISISDLEDLYKESLKIKDAKKGKRFEEFLDKFFRSIPRAKIQKKVPTGEGGGDIDFVIDFSDVKRLHKDLRNIVFIEAKNTGNVSKKDIVSFIDKLKHSNFNVGIIITTGKLGKNAKQRLREERDSEQRYILTYIEGSDWEDFFSKKYHTPEEFLNTILRKNF